MHLAQNGDLYVQASKSMLQIAPDGSTAHIEGRTSRDAAGASADLIYFIHGLSEIWTYDFVTGSSSVVGRPPMNPEYVNDMLIARDGNVWLAENNQIAVYLRFLIRSKPTSLSIPVGYSHRLEITESESAYPITVTSGDQSIATVRKLGALIYSVKGLAVGSTLISVVDSKGNLRPVPVTVYRN